MRTILFRTICDAIPRVPSTKAMGCLFARYAMDFLQYDPESESWYYLDSSGNWKQDNFVTLENTKTILDRFIAIRTEQLREAVKHPKHFEWMGPAEQEIKRMQLRHNRKEMLESAKHWLSKKAPKTLPPEDSIEAGSSTMQDAPQNKGHGS